MYPLFSNRTNQTCPLPLSVPKDAVPLQTFIHGLSHCTLLLHTVALGSFQALPCHLSCYLAYLCQPFTLNLILFWTTPSDIFSNHCSFFGYQLVLLYFSPVCWLVPSYSFPLDPCGSARTYSSAPDS